MKGCIGTETRHMYQKYIAAYWKHKEAYRQSIFAKMKYNKTKIIRTIT